MGDFWQLTVDILQDPKDPIVEKPKLQEKYLVKPPFRYCHDIITAVQNRTGFAPGLYSNAELDARAIQDKEAKVIYLQKIIDVVGLVLNQPVPAKPSKIVAGLEAESTNLFFQMLGRACKLNNGALAVQEVLGGSAPHTLAAAPARPVSRPSSQQRASDGADMGFDPPAQAEERPRDKRRESSSGKDPRAAREREKEGGGGTRERPSKQRGSSSSARGNDTPAAEAAAPRSSNPARPSSARKGQLKPPPAPPQAPPAPPPAEAEAAAPGGGRSAVMAAARAGGGGAPPSHASRPIAVMAEGAQDSDDEVEVVHEAAPAPRRRQNPGEQGILVKDIMAAEENLKKAGAAQAAGAEGAQEQGIILKRMGKAAGNAGVGSTKDFTAVREMVQKLCQTSHPLAKSMDYLQEDIESMAKEYRFWQMERCVFADKLADEERLAGDTGGGEEQSADLDSQIKQVRDRTLGLKAQVLQNDAKIEKLLAMAVMGR